MTWTEQIFTPHGFTRSDILGGRRALDLGCGARKLPGATGVDSLAFPGVDVVHDLNRFPWPFKDGEFDLVFANQYLEHAGDVLKVLGEIHRILAGGGHAVIQVPYFRAIDAFTDPTHRHYFTSASLDYAIESTRLADYKYLPCSFKKIGFWYGWPQPSKNPFARAFKSFITRHTSFYDQYLSLVMPIECLTWELERI